jgi:hypothetical protein
MRFLIIQSLPVPPLKILTLLPRQSNYLPQCERPNFTPTLNKQNHSSVNLVFASPFGCAV